MSTTKMAGMPPQGNGNGQSNLSSPASSRRLPMLRAETVSLAGANGRGGNNDATYASGSLSSGDMNAPAKADFMISFLVDARGGTMHGTRFSGVTMIMPPKTIPQPMRLTTRYVKTENLVHPPTLNEGEEMASRILQVGPVGSKFLGPIVIDVPHVASLRSGVRETAILRCDSASEGKWVEHRQKALEDSLKDWLILDSFSPTSSVTSSPSHDKGRAAAGGGGGRAASAVTGCGGGLRIAKPHQTVRVVTEDFPQYFAVITRTKQEIRPVGPLGCVLQSAQLPRARVQIPPKALTKDIDIGLSIQRIEDDVIEEFLIQGGAVSPIVTIEPRRRKFHKAITVTMPLPERVVHYNGRPSTFGRGAGGCGGDDGSSAGASRKTSVDSGHHKLFLGMTSLAENPPPEDSSQIETTLRLVCSMSGNHHRACWEDVTDDTPLVFGNGCVTFTSILSASFWLIECPNWMISDVMCLVDQLYKSTTRIPYMACFFLYARKSTSNPEEAVLHLICLTEPERADHLLELREDFVEVMRTDYVEIYDKNEIAARKEQ